MSDNRDVRWMHRRTNIADLLDDGVENYSDLKDAAAAPGQEDSDEECPPARAKVVLPGATLPEKEASPTPRASRLGVLIGACLAIACALLYLHPAEVSVVQQGRGWRWSVEHVTPERARIYGAIGVIVGIGLLAFSLYRPRADD